MIAAREGKLKVFKYLLSKGADIKAKDEDGWTVLHYAAYGGNKDIVDFLVSKGFDVNVKAKDGKTPLMIAAREGKLKVFNYLLSKGADIKAKDEDGWTIIHYAAGSKDEKAAQKMIDIALSKGIDVNTKKKDGRTPLMRAAGQGRFETFKYLLSKGADIKVKDKEGWTVLHFAAGGGNKDIVDFLVSKGFDINVKAKDGETPLTVAIGSSKTDTSFLEFLISKGADLHYRYSNGFYNVSTVSSAIFSGSIEKLKFILDKGVKISGQDKKAFYTILILPKEKHFELLKYAIKNKLFDYTAPTTMGFQFMSLIDFLFMSHQWSKTKEDIFYYLISLGFNKNGKFPAKKNMFTDFIEHPLFVSLSMCNTGGFKFLIKEGVSIKGKQRSSFVKNTLILACDDILQYSIENKLISPQYIKTYINTINSYGDTPLHNLLSKYKEEFENYKKGVDSPTLYMGRKNFLLFKEDVINTIKIAKKYNADLNIKNKEGKTVIDIAKEIGDKDILEALLK